MHQPARAASAAGKGKSGGVAMARNSDSEALLQSPPLPNFVLRREQTHLGLSVDDAEEAGRRRTKWIQISETKDSIV